jgi:hypothetical protein
MPVSTILVEARRWMLTRIARVSTMLASDAQIRRRGKGASIPALYYLRKFRRRDDQS